MTEMIIRARMASMNDLEAAQAALSDAADGAIAGVAILVTLSEIFPAGVDTAETNVGTISDGSVVVTPEDETPFEWRLTVSDTGVTETFSVLVEPALADPVQPAPSPNTLSELLAGPWDVGVALSLSTPAQDGPNLLSDANVGTAPAGVTNRVYDEVGDGFYSFDVSVAGGNQFNHNLYQPAVVPEVGTVLVIENLAASPGAVLLAKFVSGVKSTLVASLAPGAAHEYTLESGFTALRLDHYIGGIDFRLSVRVKDAIPAQTGADIDLSAAFTGGVAPVAWEIFGLPAGMTAAGAVVSGESIPAAGSGGAYEISVAATDSRGVSLTLSETVDVNEEFVLKRIAIENIAGGTTLNAGDTAKIVTDHVGWPEPYASSAELYAQCRCTFYDQNDAVLGYGETLTIPVGVTELRASAHAALDADANTTTIYATPIAVGSTRAEAAPTITAPTSGPVSGRTVTIDLGAAQGDPAPSGSVTTLTVGGVDALGDLAGGEITVAGTAAVEVAWTVTWTNSAGTATSTGSASVAEIGSTVPAAPTSGSWRVEPTYDLGTQIYLAVDEVPADATAIEWRKDGGAWTATDYVAPGVFTLEEDFRGGTQANIDLRFVNANGAGSAASKTVTPRTKNDTQFGCWADGEKRHSLTGSLSGTTWGQRLKPTGGGEVELLDWSASPFARTGADYSTANHQWTAPPPQSDSIFYDPLGSARILKPAELATRTVSTSLGTVSIAIHGAGGMAPQFARSLVGFGTGGLPVTFRFARHHLGGILPDRRRFVVGPVEILHNGGDPISIAPDATKGYALVSLDGAVLCVVARAGIIPPAGSPADLVAVHGYGKAYTRRRGVYDFAADGWDETAANGAATSNLWLRQTFESVGIYCSLAATTTCKVRFRKVGDADWYPAHDLWYDSRNHAAYPNVEVDMLDTGTATLDAVMAAKHRGVILHLEPGATYEVQIKQGTTYRQKTVKMWSHDVPRISLDLGHLEGDVLIAKSGDNITVSRPGGLPALTEDVSGGEWIELRNGSVTGEITISAGVEKIIFNDIDRHGGGRNGFLLDDGVKRIRVLGGRASGWGTLDALWCDKQAAEVHCTGKEFISEIALVGRLYGSPRHSANSWQERGDVPSQPFHPFGASILGRYTPRHGRLIVSDCAVRADGWRSYEDLVLGGRNNKPALGAVADNGPDMFIGWNYFSGWLDDGVEFEGQAFNLVAPANVFHAIEPRPGSMISKIASFSFCRGGPVAFPHNLLIYEAPDGRSQISANSSGYKIDSDKITPLADLWIYHNTMAGVGGVYGKRPFDDVGDLLVGIQAKNTIHFANFGNSSTADSTNSLSATYKISPLASPLDNAGLDADFRSTGSALVEAGEWIANVNDGGPFYATTPSIGVRMAP